MSRLLIQLSHLFLSFNSCILFDDISLSIHEGEVFALIGENGAGKTTLFRILSGLVQPDSGSLHQASHLTIGFLPQEILFGHSEVSARAYIAEGTLSNLEQQMEACLENPDQLSEWAELHEAYEKLGDIDVCL